MATTYNKDSMSTETMWYGSNKPGWPVSIEVTAVSTEPHFLDMQTTEINIRFRLTCEAYKLEGKLDFLTKEVNGINARLAEIYPQLTHDQSSTIIPERRIELVL